jgi:DNA-directed RNA polymerase
MEVAVVESGAVIKCQLCGRGELIPQAKPQDVFEHRARVAQVANEDSADKEVGKP